MDWTQVSAKWSQLKGRAKETWGRLTDDDLESIRGKRDLLVGKLSEVYGLAKKEAEREVLAFAHKAGRAMGRVARRTKSSAKKAGRAARRAGRGALGKALDGATAGLDRIREKLAPDAANDEARSGATRDPAGRPLSGAPKATRAWNPRRP